MRITQPAMVACDFDGTITVEDVTNLIWDAHVPFDWRRVLLEDSPAPGTTPLEMIARGYAEVQAAPEALLDQVRPRVHLRPGFEALVAHCRARGLPLHVVSHGLGFYLRALLPPGLAIASFEGTFTDGRWQVALPADVALAPGEDFKVHVVDRLRARHPGRAVVYVGDGRLDFPAARHSDHVFAVRGSALAQLCRQAALPCTEFEQFDEIVRALPGSPEA